MSLTAPERERSVYLFLRLAWVDDPLDDPLSIG